MASLRHCLIPTAAVVFVFALAQVRAGAQAKPAACPLTEAQTEKSIAAWAPIAAFFTGEPRCFNCHGGVNPYIAATGLEAGRPGQPASKVAHGGGAVRRGTDGTIEAECHDCHNHMPRRAGGGASVWMTAPEFLSFVDKDATTLCRQMKRRFSNANEFLGHLENDNGGIPFAEAGFVGDRALDPDVYSDIVPPAPPSKSHAELMQMARNWVDAMGGSFKGDQGCGCEYRHAGWSGQIHYTLEFSGDEGHNELQDWSGRQFTQINHVQGRASDRRDEQGRSHNGVMMWTVEWDLWRSN